MKNPLLLIIYIVILIPNIAISQLLPNSDEFNRTCSMENWKTVNLEECWNASHLEIIDIDVSNEDVLTLMPWTTAWYQNYRSNLMYKEISGNFSYTISVSSTNRAGDDVPGSSYSLAGAMVRAPIEFTDCNGGWQAGQENYVFLSLGFASGNNAPHFEVKTTINSVSNLNITSISEPEAIIKLLRINNAVIALHQVLGENWQIRQRYDRSDLPDTLMVGNVSYTDWNKANDYEPDFHNRNVINAQLDPDPANSQDTFNPDIIAKFDYGRFESLIIPAELDGLDFSDENAVPDSIILSLFAYEPISEDYQGWKIWKGKTSNWSDSINWSYNIPPSVNDSIVIPNCNCSEVVFPIMNSGTYLFKSMHIESGGQLSISAGANVEIDLIGLNSLFINEGMIQNDGFLTISNMQNKSVINSGAINTLSTATTLFKED